MITLLLSLVCLQINTEESSNRLTPEAAQAAFQQIATCLAEGPTPFWEGSLDVPMLLVDPVTRDCASNRFPGENIFTATMGVWVGTLSSGPVLDGPLFNWAGQSWTVIDWPIPPAGPERNRYLLTPLWYQKAHQLGLPLEQPANSHLETIDGRVWMRLEWRALQAALKKKGLAQRAAVADAITFRRHRRALSQNAPLQEQTSELVAGLAAYTALLLSSEPQPREWLLERLHLAEDDANFPRSFAKWSGPAYGLLLDEHRPQWRKQVSVNRDLATMLEVGMKLVIPRAWYEAVTLRARPYQVGQIQKEETDRADRKAQRLNEYRQRFVNSPQLRVPLAQTPPPEALKPSISLGDDGRYLANLTYSDAWGSLQAQRGLRLNNSGFVLYLPLPMTANDGELRGDGWLLKLASNWHVIPGSREGDLLLEEKKAETP